MEYCPQRLVGVAIDDTRLRKTGRSIPQAFYQRDPLSAPFHVNLVLGLRFLQASLLVPLQRNSAVGTRALPIRFQEVSRIKRPGKRATQEMHQQYREAAKQKNLSRSFVEMGQQLRRELDDAGGRNKVLVLAGDGSFCNRTCLAEIPERSVLLVRDRKDAKLCFRALASAPGGPRRFYGSEKFTPEQVRQDQSREWKTTKIFYGGKRRKIRYKEVAEVYWQRGAKQRPLRLIVIAPTPYRKNQGKKLYYRDPAYLFTMDLRSPPKQLLRPVADRGQPSGREGYLGRWASTAMECDFGAQTTGAGGGGLQRFVARFAPGLWGGARCRLCATPPMAPNSSTAILFGSDHATPQGDRTTTHIPRPIRPPNREF